MDGGSHDSTLQIVGEFSHLRCVSENDEGQYHAMDKGIRQSTGEVFAILNADDCYCPNILTKVAKAFAENPDADGVFGGMIYVDGQGKEIFRRLEGGFDPNIVLFGICMVLHQAFFVKKNVYERLGGYRYNDFKSAADVDFVHRMIREGCKIMHIPEYICEYRYHDFGQSADERVVANMAAETARICAESGIPGGWRGVVLMNWARLKRQWLKVVNLHKIDLIPGKFYLRRHMKARTKFSTNSGVDKLNDVKR
jgi:glycosyltransferase